MSAAELLVKVQLSLATTAGKRQALIYDGGGYFWEGDADEKLIESMGNDVKAFFYGHVDGGEFILDRRAPWQDW